MNRILTQYSEYLTFRSFYTGFPVEKLEYPLARDIEDAKSFIKQNIQETNKPCLLLSGGMDSAVLAPFMPKGSNAYTIYHSQIDSNELDIAQRYCEHFSLNHVPIEIFPEEYFSVMEDLMINKKMPLSPAEPIFHIAAKIAHQDGYQEVITGGGADTKFGGFAKLRKTVSPEAYEKIFRRAYFNPENVLHNGESVLHVLDDFLVPKPFPKTFNLKTQAKFLKNKFIDGRRKSHVVDSRQFLRDVGTERFAFDNAINLAGCTHIAPFSTFSFEFEAEKNSQEPKYFIQDLYKDIYGAQAPKKKGLQKPTFLLQEYKPKNIELFKITDLNSLHYNKKFLIYCLEQFEELRLAGKIPVS